MRSTRRPSWSSRRSSCRSTASIRSSTPGLTERERAAVADIIERRVSTRKPAPYLTGTAYIHGLRFRVDERALVPRSFIGELLADGSLLDEGMNLVANPERGPDACSISAPGRGAWAITCRLRVSER